MACGRDCATGSGHEVRPRHGAHLPEGALADDLQHLKIVRPEPTLRERRRRRLCAGQLVDSRGGVLGSRHILSLHSEKQGYDTHTSTELVGLLTVTACMFYERVCSTALDPMLRRACTRHGRNYPFMPRDPLRTSLTAAAAASDAASALAGDAAFEPPSKSNSSSPLAVSAVRSGSDAAAAAGSAATAEDACAHKRRLKT